MPQPSPNSRHSARNLRIICAVILTTLLVLVGITIYERIVNRDIPFDQAGWKAWRDRPDYRDERTIRQRMVASLIQRLDQDKPTRSAVEALLGKSRSQPSCYYLIGHQKDRDPFPSHPYRYVVLVIDFDEAGQYVRATVEVRRLDLSDIDRWYGE